MQWNHDPGSLVQRKVLPWRTWFYTTANFVFQTLLLPFPLKWLIFGLGSKAWYMDSNILLTISSGGPFLTGDSPLLHSISHCWIFIGSGLDFTSILLSLLCYTMFYSVFHQISSDQTNILLILFHKNVWNLITCDYWMNQFWLLVSYQKFHKNHLIQ